MEFTEAESNMNDLVSEYQQHHGAGGRLVYVSEGMGSFGYDMHKRNACCRLGTAAQYPKN